MVPARYPFLVALGARLGLRARLPILEGDRRRGSDRDVAGRMGDEYDARSRKSKVSAWRGPWGERERFRAGAGLSARRRVKSDQRMAPL